MGNILISPLGIKKKKKKENRVNHNIPAIIEPAF